MAGADGPVTDSTETDSTETDSKAPPGTVQAAGAVLWRPARGAVELAGGDPVEVAVVHRPRYDDWSLPKGKLDPDETLPGCAVREVREETGFAATLGRRLGVVEYPAPAPVGWHKCVHYFSARAGHGEFVPNREVDELRWLSVEDASRTVSRPADADILAAFAAVPQPLHTMLLVRHAKAGNKADWQDDDRLRPLSCAGQRQAEALRGMLPLFGVERILAAPRVRCVQTVQGVADDLGIRVVAEDLFSEEGYRAHEGAAVDCLLRLSGLPGTSVVCSQGGVVPDVVRRLLTRDRLHAGPDVDGVASKKGSVWALSFADVADCPRLVAADYYPTALPAPASNSGKDR